MPVDTKLPANTETLTNLEREAMTDAKDKMLADT